MPCCIMSCILRPLHRSHQQNKLTWNPAHLHTACFIPLLNVPLSTWFLSCIINLSEVDADTKCLSKWLFMTINMVCWNVLLFVYFSFFYAHIGLYGYSVALDRNSLQGYVRMYVFLRSYVFTSYVTTWWIWPEQSACGDNRKMSLFLMGDCGPLNQLDEGIGVRQTNPILS